MATNTTNFCLKSSVTDSDWEVLYKAAFKEDQRTPMSQLHDGVRSGQLLLHRTVETQQGLLCFTITNILPSVALLAYIATDSTKRSSGIGSKHLKQLLKSVAADHPKLLGLFAEIESTREKDIDEEAKKQRKRRLAFYQRLGFKRLQSDYRIPSYDVKAKDEAGELLWYEFGSTPIGCERMAAIVKEIYTDAYHLKEDDARVVNISIEKDTSTGCIVALGDAETAEPAPSTQPVS